MSLFANSFFVVPLECDVGSSESVLLSRWNGEHLFSFKRKKEVFRAKLRQYLENNTLGVIFVSPVLILTNA
jgi:hypothetical protein